MKSVYTGLAFLATGLILAGCDGCKSKQKSEAEAPVAKAPSSAPAPGNAQSPTTREAPRLAPVPTEPLSDDDVASCATADSLLKRVSCLGSLAQRNRDPRFCAKIAEVSKGAGEEEPDIVRSGTAANACLRTVAFMRDDAALCSKIDRASMAGSCLSYFAMKRQQPAVCDVGGGGEASQTCYLNEAARTRDASLCGKTGQFQEDCAKRLGPIAD